MNLFFSEFSEARNEILENLRSNEPTSGTCTTEIDGGTAFIIDCCESSRANVETAVMPLSQQQIMELSCNMSPVRDVAEGDEYLQPENLVPKSEHADDEREEPMDDTGVPINDTNVTDEQTEPAYDEQNLDQCSSADSLLREKRRLKTQPCSGMRLRARRPKALARPLQEAQRTGAEGRTASSPPAAPTRDRQHRCDVCGAAFVKAHDLVIHGRRHTGERPFCCDACGKAFAHRSTLVVHLRQHTGERPYRCDACDKAFAYPSALRKHARTHTGERPYRCDVCGDDFARLGHLARHKRVHVGERPYRCGVCGIEFAHAHTLGKHVRLHRRHVAAMRSKTTTK